MTRDQARTAAIQALIDRGFFLVADLPAHVRVVEVMV